MTYRLGAVACRNKGLRRSVRDLPWENRVSPPLRVSTRPQDDREHDPVWLTELRYAGRKSANVCEHRDTKTTDAATLEIVDGRLESEEPGKIALSGQE